MNTSEHKENDKTTTLFSLRLPPEILRQVEYLASKRNWSRNQTMVQLVKKGLESHEERSRANSP